MAKHVVIAGGGTGGHLYPGIALARALMKYDSETQITFVGTERGLEARVLPREGFDLKTITSTGLLGKKGWQRWASLLRLPVGLIQSLWLLFRHRPDLVVGVGGYVSGPLVLAARMLQVPILIHEQNTVPGATNLWLGKIADQVAVSFETSKKYFPEDKVQFTGNMIREEFSQALEPSGLPSGKFTVLILGGSQGARSINRGVLDALELLQPVRDRLHFIHQTGAEDEEKARKKYARLEFSAEAHAFIHDMAGQYRRASLIICRAGATTLAELTAMGRAAVLVPFPFAAHNHQEHNARALEKAGAAEMLLDRDIDGGHIARTIVNGLNSPDLLLERCQKSYRLGRREATLRVRNLCLELMKTAA